MTSCLLVLFLCSSSNVFPFKSFMFASAFCQGTSASLAYPSHARDSPPPAGRGPAGGGVQGVGGLPAGGEGPCASGCGATHAEFLRSRGATQRRHAEKGRPSSRWHSLLGKPHPCQAPALVTRGHRGLATLRLPLASRCIGLTRLSTGWSKFRLEQSAC